jgi:hypothetical protein
MPNRALVMTNEIRSLAVKKITAQVGSKRRAVAHNRCELTALKRQVAACSSPFTAILLIVALVELRVATVAAADLPTNLVTNPSLEEEVARDGLPPGWGWFVSVPAGAYRATIADGGRTGKREMRIDYVGGQGEGAFGGTPANRVPLDATKRYVARGWVKVTGGRRATADVKFLYFAGDGAYLGQTRVGFVSPGNDDWQLVTVTDHAEDYPQARLIALAIACTGDAHAQYDDLGLLAFDKDKLPADFESTYGVTLSPQLAVLARRVGTWETRTKTKPCLWAPQGAESTGIETFRWMVGGQLLLGQQRLPEGGIEQMSLITYDARDQVYRCWLFGSDPTFLRGQTVGRWDQATETLTFQSDPRDELDAVVRIKLIGNDTVNWHEIRKNKAGQVLLDVEGTSKRRQEKR